MFNKQKKNSHFAHSRWFVSAEGSARPKLVLSATPKAHAPSISELSDAGMQFRVGV